jgi:hypothetical protein
VLCRAGSAIAPGGARATLGRVKREAEQQPERPWTEDEKRLFALAVLAGSVAPRRDLMWMLDWKRSCKQLARLPLRRRRRLTAYSAMALCIPLTGFVFWTVASGRG